MSAEVVSEKNPLLIDMVLHHLFGFFSGNELKILRQVCNKWKTIAEGRFMSKTRYCFPPYHVTCLEGRYSSIKLMKNLMDTFREEGPTRSLISFFHGRVEISDLEIFFHSAMGRTITQLTFHNVVITRNGKAVKRFNLSEIIRHVGLKCLVMVRGRPLYEGRRASKGTALTVALASIPLCEHLYLRDNTLILNGNISPKKFFLLSANILNAERKKVSGMILNNFIDFTNCTDLELSGNTPIALDMSRVVYNLQKATLWMQRTENWEGARGTIEELDMTIPLMQLDNRPLIKITTMQIRAFVTIDLACLPDSLELLSLEGSSRIPLCGQVINTQPGKFLPNLKCLRYIIHIRNACLLEFRDFPRLESLELLQESHYPTDQDDKPEGDGFEDDFGLLPPLRTESHNGTIGICKVVDIKFIPVNVRHLSITSIMLSNTMLEPHRLHPLDTLITDFQSVQFLKAVLLAVHPRTIIFAGSFDFTWTMKTYQQLLILMKHNNVKYLALGPLTEEEENPVLIHIKSLLPNAKFCRVTSNGIPHEITERKYRSYFAFCTESFDYTLDEFHK